MSYKDAKGIVKLNYIRYHHLPDDARFIAITKSLECPRYIDLMSLTKPDREWYEKQFENEVLDDD